jgi:hypothetical protein
MEEVVQEKNPAAALGAAKRNQRRSGDDQMKTSELGSHLQKHWLKIRAKLEVYLHSTISP